VLARTHPTLPRPFPSRHHRASPSLGIDDGHRRNPSPPP
jgi:hypothetical protein